MSLNRRELLISTGLGALAGCAPAPELIEEPEPPAPVETKKKPRDK